MEALIAIELSVTERSLVDLKFGKGHSASSKIACTVGNLRHPLDISVQINFIIHSERTVMRVTSSRYRREATPTIAQKRVGHDLW